MSRDPEFYFVQAERLITEGQYAAAELMLRQAAELAGNDRVYVAILAALLGHQEGRGEEAMALVEEHLAHQPEEPNLLVARGMTARVLGQNELAEESLRKAVQLNSNHAYAHHSLSKVLIEQGRSEDAEKHACKAFALVPDQPDYALTAIELLEASGKQDYAYEVASLGASFCPQEMELVQKAVQYALEREEPERAWDALEESNDDLPWVLGWKATLLDHQGQLEKSEALLEIGREKFFEEPEFLFLEAAILVRRQQSEAALEVIERILELAPTHRGALRLRADLSISSQSTEEALQDLQAMLEIEPEDEAVALELASGYYQAHRYREAQDVCQDWEERGQPLPPRMAVYRMLCSASLGDTQEALERLPEIPSELIFPAITELNTFGCGNASEQALREKLMLALPQEPEPVPEATGEPGEESEEESEPESPSEPEAESATEEPGVRLQAPLMPGYHGLLGESPAYDEDELDEDEEIWVEIDEETGEEYVWIEVDEDDDDDL